jgi:hypothetical protein
MYSRTENEDGTYNTRCLYCFLTIARSIPSEAKLAKLEARHICPEMAMAQLWEKEKAFFALHPTPPASHHIRPN